MPIQLRIRRDTPCLIVDASRGIKRHPRQAKFLIPVAAVNGARAALEEGMKRLRIARILALGLLLLLPSTLVRAQDTPEPPHAFGCSSTQAESTFSADLNHPSKMQLVPVTDAYEIQQAEAGAGVFHTLYSKIDSSRYKVSRVDFYVHQDRPKDPQGSPGYSPITIYVKRTSSGKALWWKVVEGEREALTESFLSAQLPNVDEEHPSSPAVILAATGDGTIPIFDVQWGSQQLANWADSIEAHILLDLRAPQPKIVADLSFNSVTAFGACGVYDAQQQDKTNYECDWISANDDFRCTGTTWHDASKRQTKTWFALIGGKDR